MLRGHHLCNRWAVERTWICALPASRPTTTRGGLPRARNSFPKTSRRFTLRTVQRYLMVSSKLGRGGTQRSGATHRFLARQAPALESVCAWAHLPRRIARDISLLLRRELRLLQRAARSWWSSHLCMTPRHLTFKGYFGGGYPQALRGRTCSVGVFRFCSAGRPVYAEVRRMMYLCEGYPATRRCAAYDGWWAGSLCRHPHGRSTSGFGVCRWLPAIDTVLPSRRFKTRLPGHQLLLPPSGGEDPLDNVYRSTKRDRFSQEGFSGTVARNG